MFVIFPLIVIAVLLACSLIAMFSPLNPIAFMLPLTQALFFVYTNVNSFNLLVDSIAMMLPLTIFSVGFKVLMFLFNRTALTPHVESN